MSDSMERHKRRNLCNKYEAKLSFECYTRNATKPAYTMKMAFLRGMCFYRPLHCFHATQNRSNTRAHLQEALYLHVHNYIILFLSIVFCTVQPNKKVIY